MSGVGISGLIANLPGTVTPYPTQDPALELGGYRAVANAAARDAIPANFRSIGMAVTLQDTGVEYKLIGGITNADWVPQADAAVAFIIRATLAALTAQDNANLPNGCLAYVVAEQELYQLDTLNPLTTFSPLIVARGGSGTGKWYRRNRAYVVGNYTLWAQSFGFGVAGYTPGQLLATGATEPDILLDMRPFVPAPVAQQQLTVDVLGNLWLTWSAHAASNTIRKYRLRDCLVSGAPAAALAFQVPTPIDTESGLVTFDRHNGLWTMTGGHGGPGGVASAVRFGPRAYSRPNGVAGISLTATASPPTSTQQDMLFDGQGNLWMSIGFTTASNGAIVMWTEAQCQAGGTAAPTVFWAGANFASPNVGGCTGLAIGANNWIWATDYNANRIRAWDMTNAASGDPAPVVTLTSTSFNGPYSIAFDADGNLWVNNGNVTRLMRIPAASLLVSGAVVPDVIVSPVVAGLTSNIIFPNTPERSGLLPAGFP